MRTVLPILIVAVLAGLPVQGSRAGESHDSGASQSAPLKSDRVAVLMERDGRATLEGFAMAHKFDRSAMHRRFGASGIVRCNGAVGTAQLTVRADVITTAAHVLIGPDGRPREGCRFEPNLGSGPVAIDIATLRAGSRRPLAEPATRDWAVVRLAAPVAGARPYRLANAGAIPQHVWMCAAGNGAATRMGAEQCRARHVVATAADGIREVAIDCSGASGGSGAGLVAGHALVAIYVGYRSTTPNQARPFSEQHYNFAITVEGPFRLAVLAATGR